MSFNLKLNINDYNIDVDIVANLDESNNKKKKKINKSKTTFSKIANNRYINQNQFMLENANVDVMKMHESIKNSHEKKRYVKDYTKYLKNFHNY